MYRQEYRRKNCEDATGMCPARLHFAVTMLLGETVKMLLVCVQPGAILR